MNLDLKIRHTGDHNADFYEIINVTPHPIQLEAMALFHAIGIKAPLGFGGSVRDLLHEVPTEETRDIDVLGCYKDIGKGSIEEVAAEIKKRLSARPNVSNVTAEIKFNHHTGTQRIVTMFQYKGVNIDASLEDIQPTIAKIAARENVSLSAAYIHADGRIIAHKSFIEDAKNGVFKITAWQNSKRFLLAIQRYRSLKKRNAYNHLGFRLAAGSIIRSLKHRKPEPFPGISRIMYRIRKAASRPNAKRQRDTGPTEPRA